MPSVPSEPGWGTAGCISEGEGRAAVTSGRLSSQARTTARATARAMRTTSPPTRTWRPRPSATWPVRTAARGASACRCPVSRAACTEKRAPRGYTRGAMLGERALIERRCHTVPHTAIPGHSRRLHPSAGTHGAENDPRGRLHTTSDTRVLLERGLSQSSSKGFVRHSENPWHPMTLSLVPRTFGRLLAQVHGGPVNPPCNRQRGSGPPPLARLPSTLPAGRG
jgi:hypothetical protein